VITQSMNTALVKYFSANELEVLANFYSNPDAKTAMAKMNLYTTEILPVLQAEMLKAQQKAFNTQNNPSKTEDRSPGNLNQLP